MIYAGAGADYSESPLARPGRRRLLRPRPDLSGGVSG